MYFLISSLISYKYYSMWAGCYWRKLKTTIKYVIGWDTETCHHCWLILFSLHTMQRKTLFISTLSMQINFVFTINHISTWVVFPGMFDCTQNIKDNQILCPKWRILRLKFKRAFDLTFVPWQNICFKSFLFHKNRPLQQRYYMPRSIFCLVLHAHYRHIDFPRYTSRHRGGIKEIPIADNHSHLWLNVNHHCQALEKGRFVICDNHGILSARNRRENTQR